MDPARLASLVQVPQVLEVIQLLAHLVKVITVVVDVVPTLQVLLDCLFIEAVSPLVSIFINYQRLNKPSQRLNVSHLIRPTPLTLLQYFVDDDFLNEYPREQSEGNHHLHLLFSNTAVAYQCLLLHFP